MNGRTMAIAGAVLLVPSLVSSQERERVGRIASPPAVVSAAQFKGFQWIAGRWSGLGTGRLAAVGVFFEEYTVIDDSTMKMRTARDSTFTNFSDSTRFELRAGTMSAVPARGSVQQVVRFAGDTVQWNGTGTLYVRFTNDLWRAVFPARSLDGERPHYELRRIGR